MRISQWSMVLEPPRLAPCGPELEALRREGNGARDVDAGLLRDLPDLRQTESTFLASVPLREIRAFWGIARFPNGSGLRRLPLLDLVHDARGDGLTMSRTANRPSCGSLCTAR